MIVSDARREANRRNALRSTGPRTEEGKERSRRNALKHGLTALVVVPEDAAAVQDRASAYFWSLKPRNVLQRHLVDEMAVLSLRVDRAQRIERKLRDRVALRAVDSWDDDRRLDAERLGRDLASRPSEVVAELRRTPQGCDWLLDRWAMLARLADAEGSWPEPARRLAFDLLGTPPELRAGHPGAAIDPDGHLLDDGADHAAVARARIAALRLDREAVAEHDAIDRELAEADLSDAADPEIRRVRRYESALHRRLRWCLARMKDPIPEHRPPFDLIPDYNPKSEAEALAEAQAEADAKAERDAKFEAEYHAKAERRQAEARKREEARARRRRPAPKTPDEATAQRPNEATPGEPNEATEPAPNGATAGPGSPADRHEARARKADTRRDARKRKRDRRRA